MDLHWHKADIARQGGDTEAVDHLAALLAGAPLAGWNPILVRLHEEADRLPFAGDSDYAALVLERAASETDDPARKTTLLNHALQRAERCASCATAGGEGLARMVDVERLRRKRASHTDARNTDARKGVRLAELF